MRRLISRVSGPFDTVFCVVWAGLLWAFTSIPLITVFASTSALTAVVAARKDRNEQPIWRLYKDAFVAQFRQSVVLALVWGVAGVVLWADFYFGVNAHAGMALRVPAAAAALLGGIVAAGSAAFACQLLVKHPAPVRVQIRNAVLLSLANIGTTLLCALLLAAGVVASYLVAPALPVLGYLVVALQYRLTARAVSRTLVKAERHGVDGAEAPAAPKSAAASRS
ncbi:hypothetical protein BIV57_21775 [Mangrovactinospora gilvigrisea]|uniref:DUF624 domain-containing protein n=1 Tax=Mangrovactinospora gilvigrisea TaxID=1428644 RepID=A0A1J7B9R6_9ACTN|nr:YesL family protein [Mangrovactinospora gilvigrisea]OIV35423.1 hypothetical protein BIV57_21775 [Mangrovactinospora gilvigrisea]